MASASHDAAPSAVGYPHQTWWALVELLRSGADRPDAAITLELHDDVAWEQAGNPTQLLQVKHHQQTQRALTDASTDLWRTLRVWMDTATPGDATGAQVDFVLDGDLARISAPMDFLGIDFYEQHRVVGDPAHTPTIGNVVRGACKLDPTPPVTAGNVAIRPNALYRILTRVHREWTGLPLWITENGLALHDYVGPDGQCHDPERIDYLAGHFAAAARAIADGVSLEAYLAWSLMDNFEWAEGYSLRFGLGYVDYATQVRIPKGSAQWFRHVIRENGRSILPPGKVSEF